MKKLYLRGVATGVMIGFAVALLSASIATGNSVGVVWFAAGLTSAVMFAYGSAPVGIRKWRKTLPPGWPFD